MPTTHAVDLVIPISTAVSQLVNVGNRKIFALEFPGAMDGATVTLEGCADGLPASAVAVQRQDGTAVSVTFAASVTRGITNAEDALVVATQSWLRVRSASTETAERTIRLHVNS